MSTHTLRLLEDRLPAPPPGTPAASVPSISVPAANRIVYVVEGGVTVAHPTGGRSIVTDDAWVGSAPITLKPGPQGARLWRWELVADPASDDGQLPGGISRPLLASALELDPGEGWLMRCDRVDFPLGGIAYTHVHRGPGIRCCAKGEIRVESMGQSHTMRAGEPWFERGPDPVIAYTSEQEETAFVRGFVLPRELKGISSIRYVKPEDQDKPKPQRYRIYGEEFVEL